MYVIFFILLCVAVTVIVGLTAHFARKEDEDETPAATGGGTQGTGG